MSSTSMILFFIALTFLASKLFTLFLERKAFKARQKQESLKKRSMALQQTVGVYNNVLVKTPVRTRTITKVYAPIAKKQSTITREYATVQHVK